MKTRAAVAWKAGAPLAIEILGHEGAGVVPELGAEPFRVRAAA